jgi:hypothetical protein
MISHGGGQTDESRAFRAKLQAMRPYQVKSECKKLRLDDKGDKEALIEALVTMEFGANHTHSQQTEQHSQR